MVKGLLQPFYSNLLQTLPNTNTDPPQKKVHEESFLLPS